MAVTKTRVACPHCGRSIALVGDGAICRHGRHGRPCPGSKLTPINGAITDKQLEFVKHCWQSGDALPVARLFGTECPTLDIPEGLTFERELWELRQYARGWIESVYRDYQQRVNA